MSFRPLSMRHICQPSTCFPNGYVVRDSLAVASSIRVGMSAEAINTTLPHLLRILLLLTLAQSQRCLYSWLCKSATGGGGGQMPCQSYLSASQWVCYLTGAPLWHKSFALATYKSPCLGKEADAGLPRCRVFQVVQQQDPPVSVWSPEPPELKTNFGVGGWWVGLPRNPDPPPPRPLVRVLGAMVTTWPFSGRRGSAENKSFEPPCRPLCGLGPGLVIISKPSQLQSHGVPKSTTRLVAMAWAGELHF